MLRWVTITGGLGGLPTSLQLRGYEVARLDQRVDGSWTALLRRHLPHEQQIRRACQSYESGRTGCELWAARHADELEAWAKAREDEWVARTPWLPRPE